VEVQHRPVQLAESLDLLAVERGGVYVDATVGLGGHAAALLARGSDARLVGIDQDPDALERAGRRLAEFGDRVRLVQGNFFDLGELLAGLGIQTVAGVLADLGVSSLQLETAERGFSFRREGPLDMRMGRMGQTDGGGDLTAADVVNGYSEGDLERIFRDYGEERQARRLARAIAAARSRAPLKTTGELKALIDRVKGHPPRGYRGGREGREGRVDPATRVFQALRIEVNRELEGLERFLDQAVRLLEADGRLVVISYHSLEDRIVKNTLRDLARGQVDPVTGRPQAESRLIEMLTRKPVRPTDLEVDLNPRSRSARLRAARRLAPP
jgi:16S rRNA (cytosine1402-N4)-methyltransferase